MSGLWRRLFRRRQIDEEILEELESHLQMRAEFNRQAGMSEEEAWQDARRRFGNPNRVRQQLFDFNGFGILDEFFQDLRDGLRTTRRFPAITLLALLSLTLGIGANTLAFTFVNVLLFSSLTYPAPDRLVIVEEGLTTDECQELIRYREILRDFGCTAGLGSSASITGGSSGEELPENLQGMRLTAGAGRALAVRPSLGRWLEDRDEELSAQPVAVIGARLWQQRFAEASDVIGQRIVVNGVATTIVGVMPADFDFLNSSVEIWLPLHNQERGGSNQRPDLLGVGRLQEEATLDQARSLLDALVVRRAEQASRQSQEVRFERLDRFVSARFGDSALILQGTVAFVLLIACANVAGLLLTQGASQQRELAVRAALGCGTWRIIRRVIIHHLMLFSAGGLTGLVAGWGGARFMSAWILTAVQAYGAPRGGIPRGILEAGIDGRVFLFTFALALLCGLLAAIAPALQSGRSHPLEILRGASEQATLTASRHRTRNAFVTLQIALAFVLLVGASLMLNGLRQSLEQDLGFDVQDLLSVQIHLPSGVSAVDHGLHRETGRIDPLQILNSKLMRQELAGTTAVESATAIAIAPPLSGAVNLLAAAAGSAREPGTIQFLPILPDYFKTLGVRLTRGREFGEQDLGENLPVAILNQTAAELFWPGEDPLGRSIQLRSPGLPDEPPRQVIGVVPEVKQYSFQRGRPQLYLPFSQVGRIDDEVLKNRLHDLTFIVRTSRAPEEIASALAAAISRVSPQQSAPSIRSLELTIFAASLRRGAYVKMVAVFGAIAVALAVMGVYGVMANLVVERFQELGIRVALGATPGRIRRVVIGRGLVLIGIGIALGLPATLAVTQMLRSMLFGLSPTDPATFASGVLLLAGVALLACSLPAWRASRVDALVALRR